MPEKPQQAFYLLMPAEALKDFYGFNSNETAVKAAMKIAMETNKPVFVLASVVNVVPKQLTIIEDVKSLIPPDIGDSDLWQPEEPFRPEPKYGMTEGELHDFLTSYGWQHDSFTDTWSKRF